MSRIAWMALLIAAVGCGDRVRPDPAAAALPSNYPTAEIYACGQHFVGLGRCTLRPGEPLSALGLEVQGYYEGQVRVFSERLGLDYALTYRESSRLPVLLAGTLEEPVMIGVVVSPTYPGQAENPVEVHPVVGYLLVEPVRSGEIWGWVATKTPAGVDAWVEIETFGASEIDVSAPECDVQKTIPATGARTRVALSRLVSTRLPGRCLFHFASHDRMHTWMSWRYDTDFRPLSIPSVKVEGKRLRIVAEPGVSVISLDRDWYIDHQAKFRWDPALPHVLRALTVKGRVAVGEWSPERKEFVWKR